MVETSELDPRIQCERDPETHVARLTIDNPDRRNAYDPPMRRAMRTHLDEIATDDDIKVVILRGVDGVFSTGADMANSYAWYGNDPDQRRPSQRRRLGVDREAFGFYHELMAYPKVTVAQVETYALGGGFEIALMADIAVVGARRQARDARRAAARSGARQPAPLLPPARSGADPPAAAHRRHDHRRRGGAPRRVHRGVRTRRGRGACRAVGHEGRRACPPTASPSPRPASPSWSRAPPYVGEEASGFLVHAFATNLRFEGDEFNFVKTRAKVGTSEAFKVRDEHFGVDGLP